MLTFCLKCADDAWDFSESGFRLQPVSWMKVSHVLRDPTGSCGLSQANDTIQWISSELNGSLCSVRSNNRRRLRLVYE